MGSRHVRGPLVFNTYKTVLASNYTVVNESLVIVNKTVGAATTITLPAPTATDGRRCIQIVDGKGDAATNVITVVAASGLVSGAASYLINTNYGSASFVDNGTGWVRDSGSAGAGAGNVGAVAGNGATVQEQTSGAVTKTIITLASTTIGTTDGTTNGAQGTLKVYDFPEGNLTMIGATMNLTTLAGAGGLADTAALVGSLGTATPGVDATLTGTEADLIPSTAGTLTAGAGTMKGRSTTTQLVQFDGTATAKDAYLNFAVVDAGSSADDSITVNGTITIIWANSGDY